MNDDQGCRAGKGRSAGQDVGAAYLHNITPLRRYVGKLLGRKTNADDVDDIMQEIYVRAFRSKRNEKLVFAKAYLYRVARNLAFKTNKKKSNPLEQLVEDFADQGIIDNIALPDEQLHQKQRLRVFFEAVDRLPPQCRKVFILRQLDGLSHQEISRRLGISTSTVEKHIAKGLRLSAQYMADAGYETHSASVVERKTVALK